ncbi:MAG: Hsp33 family molecular chaperone HslO [Clostridiaceae bacterium]|jgi:molecular chaperone Hsp33|nr:Hsp33 family molecular chaperone HslO [Clostridiaceae bacterium]
MEDQIVRATAAGGAVRAFAAVTTELVQKAHITHGTSGVASAALGRTLTAAAMMGRMFKNERDQLTIQIKGDGPLGGIITVSDAESNVRGYVYEPQVYLPLNAAGKFDVARAVGKNGYLNVIKDMGLKEPYVGYVDLVSGEIGEDMAYYFASSEQIPTVVSLGVLVDTDENVVNAGGYIIQLMPGADESIIDFIEDKVFLADSITYMLSTGMDAEAVLDSLLGEKELVITDRLPCKYKCNCSRERMERNLISLGAKELEEMAQEQHGAEVQCHFCNTKYQFTEAELRGLI